MKKGKFYSLISDHGYVFAVEQTGYIDDKYNYYKRFNQWYAICKKTGLSVAVAYRRKDAVKIANKSHNQYLEHLKQHGLPLMIRFDTLVSEKTGASNID